MSANESPLGDQFFTPRETAIQVVEKILEDFPETKELNWLEPAAGTGTFVDAAIECGIALGHLQGYEIKSDLIPAHLAGKIMPSDFFGAGLGEIADADSVNSDTWIAFGTPPFGEDLIKFFNQCAHLCDRICFIVPVDWHKTANTDSSFELIDEYGITANYETADGELHEEANKEKVCVQMWCRV